MKPPKSLKNNRLLSDKASLSKFKSSSDFGLKLRNWPSRIRVDEALKKSVKRKKHKKREKDGGEKERRIGEGRIG